MNIYMDYREIITHILSNLSEAYKKIVENQEDKLDDKIDPLELFQIQMRISFPFLCT